MYDNTSEEIKCCNCLRMYDSLIKVYSTLFQDCLFVTYIRLVVEQM